MSSLVSRSESGQRTITPYTLTSPVESAAGHVHQAVAGERRSGTDAQESRSSSEPSPDLSRSASARSARLSSSLLPNLRLAGLVYDSSRDRDMSRRRDQTPKPKPLLTLKLSGSSFLDTVIRDDKTKDPLYILETSNEVTSIYRLDHPRDEPVKAATVQWPLHPVRVKGKSGRSIQFGGGSWREAEDVLKSGPLGNTAIRKFNIPHYPNSLKWKLIPGNCFCCVTNAVKGPVAVLDAATLSAPPRIKIYDTLIAKDVARSQDNYKGIPTILIDYLIVTAFLLVTDVQEWLDRPREARIPGGNSYTVQRWLALIHHRPAPPEPEHPVVDLSLTVPSTPPHSATFPSPGGFWETQSGVTSMSGSNGSGSGASYLGEPFTPTTPATPATPATSIHSSAFSSRPIDDPPPVPPVPGPSGSSQSRHVRERPKSNPTQSTSHSPSSSTSTAQAPAATTQTDDEEESNRPLRTRPPQTLSLPPHVQESMLSSPIAPSTSAPTTPHPTAPPPRSVTASSSTRPPRRQLPTPPGPAPPNSFAQPWLYSSSATSPTSAPISLSTSLPSASVSSAPSASPATPSTPASASAPSRAARVSRGSLRTAPIPPPPPPPQHSIPLPPKLAQEQQGYVSQSGSRPRTAPEIDSARRRHSAGEFGEYSGFEGTSSSVHPYAAAAQTHSPRERDRNGLARHMQGLRITPVPGPSNIGGHVRAPSQPAPDYDTHSFVNSPPPLPPLPLPQQGDVPPGARSPPSQGSRVLRVVNADATTMPIEDPGRCLPSERVRPPRVSYPESVYEAPPPAYDAIDFSVPPVPPLRSVPSRQLLQIAPLPVPPEGGEMDGYRGS